MGGITNRAVGVVGLAVLITTSVGAASAGTVRPPAPITGKARLYEMTENMRLDGDGNFVHRKATSELIGTADVGTPLCPQSLVDAVSPGALTCTVNATGSDNISLQTGLGDFAGSFTVVIQGDNPSDSPELVVARGTFKGKMDFAPAVLMGIPLGHVTGRLSSNSWKTTVPFNGTFRLPFVIAGVHADGNPCTPSAADPSCIPVNDAALFGNLPLPLTPMERYDLTVATRPLYLLDNGGLVPVGSSEFGGGWAAVKFEINF